MISRLQGTLLEKSLEQVVIDVGGVGYEALIPQSTFDQLGAPGSDVILLTHLIVREDAHQLFGFASTRERELFRSLIKVNKVGPKLAIAILSGLSTEALVKAIRDDDVKAINAIAGVGKVTAERVIMELRNKLPDWQSDIELPPVTPVNDVMADAESALIELGYRPQEAAHALAQLEPDLSLQEAIRQALRQLS